MVSSLSIIKQADNVGNGKTSSSGRNSTLMEMDTPGCGVCHPVVKANRALTLDSSLSLSTVLFPFSMHLR